MGAHGCIRCNVCGVCPICVPKHEAMHGYAAPMLIDPRDAELSALRAAVAELQHSRAIQDEANGMLRAEVESLRAGVREVLADWHTGHAMHWDREGTGGAHCPACALDGQARERLRALMGGG